jgi:transcriptional regulator NrdR family protein
MRCPFCHNPDSRVVDSRETDEGATTRRRRMIHRNCQPQPVAMHQRTTSRGSSPAAVRTTRANTIRESSTS